MLRPMADTGRALPSGLLPSDEWLIQMVREGRVDADIGGELGLSAGEVRDRIAAVAAKLDVDGRAGIQRYFGGQAGSLESDAAGGHFRRRWVWAAAAAVVVVAVGVASVVGLTRDSGGSHAAAASASASATAKASAEIAAENPNGWFDAGPLFFVDGTTQPVLDSSVRVGFTALTMAGPGLIEFNAGNVKWTSGSKNPLGTPIVGVATGTVNGEQLGLSIQAGENTTLIADSSATIRFFGTNGLANPTLLVSTGKRANVGKDGRLFIDQAPRDPEAVLNADTGEQLNVTKAQRLSPEGSNFAVTRCGGAISNDDGGRCYVAWFGGEALMAPADGVLTCLPNGSWQLTTAAVVLNFAGSDQTVPPSTTGQLVRCVQPTSGSHTVEAGYQISDHGTAFRITATTVDGKTPLSVAIGDDGAMYVGFIPVTVGCPCLAGP